MEMEDAAARAVEGRRKLKSRRWKWTNTLAAAISRTSISPNFISILSVVSSAIGAAAVAFSSTQNSPLALIALFALCIAGMQFRLLCNLIDGMVAVEGGKLSRSGELFNDAPDRLSDVLLMIGFGIAAGGTLGMTLGWCAATLSIGTAYIRVLGRSIGAGIYFRGPMAKQHRMFVMTTACAINCIACVWNFHRDIFIAALTIVILGCVVTIARRLQCIARDLESK